MIYVTMGGKHKGLGDLNSIHGGSAYGAGTISGGDGNKLLIQKFIWVKLKIIFKGMRQPSELELEIAQFQG